MPGATVKYYKGGEQTLGVTDVNGQFSQLISDIPGTTTFYLLPANGGRRIWLNIDPATNPTLTAQMEAVTIDLKTCSGTPPVGEAKYYRNGWTSLGNTPVTVDLLPYTSLGPGQGSYDFQMKYDGRTSATMRQDISADATVDFTTTTVDFAFAGPIQYYNGGWQTFVGPKEMIGGTQNYGSGNISQAEFRFGSPVVYQAWINITGCTVGGVVNVIKVLDHTGSPISGATARGGVGANYGTWSVTGSTDANGLLIDIRPLPVSGSGYSYEARVNNTTAVIGPLTTNYYEFQTQLMTLRMETCDGTPIDGGVPAYGYGTNGGAWFFPGGNTGSSASGESEAEIFPGTYSFRMQYKATTEFIYSYNFPTDGATVTWTTTKVTLNYAGAISYGGASGTSTWFTKPSMELLHGTYNFKFFGAATVPLTFSDCTFGGVINFIKVLDHNGAPIAGAKARGGKGTSYFTWHVAGSTDANGLLIDIRPLPVSATGYSYEAKVNNTTAVIGPLTTNYYEFQTQLITLRMETCDANPIDLGSPAYSSGTNTSGGTWWFPGGKTGVSAPGESEAEFFPGTYSFRMQYKATQEIIASWNFPTDGTTVTWTTTKVTLNYASSISYGGSSGTSTWFTKPSMELLHGTYNFKFFGAGTVPLTFSDCTFGGVINIIKVLDHNGSPIAGVTARGGVGASYGTWFVPGSTDANGLLLDIRPLPASATGYSYEAKVNNTTAVIGPLTTNFYLFNTELLTLRLETCEGTPLDGGHVRWGHGANYSTSHFIGGNTGSSATGETSAEFFPGIYSFEMGLSGTTDTKISYNFPTDGATVLFTTTKVILSYNNTISYGGPSGTSAWFTKPSMELMPGGTYKFKFTGGNLVDIAISGCEINKAMLLVKDELNNPVAGVTFKAACGGSWQTPYPGQTDASGGLLVDLQPCMTKISASLINNGQELSKAQLEASGYKWTTEVLRVNLKDHVGNAITDGTGSLQQGGSTWVALGNFNASGYVDVATFPVTNGKYVATYNFTSETKYVAVPAD